MTPAEKIEKAFDDAHLVIAAYLEPGPRNAEETLDQLIRIIDDWELHDAVIELLADSTALHLAFGICPSSPNRRIRVHEVSWQVMYF